MNIGPYASCPYRFFKLFQPSGKCHGSHILSFFVRNYGLVSHFISTCVVDAVPMLS